MGVPSNDEIQSSTIMKESTNVVEPRRTFSVLTHHRSEGDTPWTWGFISTLFRCNEGNHSSLRNCRLDINYNILIVI